MHSYLFFVCSRNLFKQLKWSTSNSSAKSGRVWRAHLAHSESSPLAQSLQREHRRCWGAHRTLSHWSSQRDFAFRVGVSRWRVLFGDVCKYLTVCRPSTDFVAPLMVVERHKREVRERQKRPPKHTQCHYQGKVRGHENSKVALSACNGLVRFKDLKNTLKMKQTKMSPSQRVSLSLFIYLIPSDHWLPIKLHFLSQAQIN
jgi:hypothetical protein